MKIILNRDKHVYPILCISIIFGLLLIYIAVSGYLQVYLFHTAEKTIAMVQGTYLTCTGPDEYGNTNSKYTYYEFTVGDKIYTGKEACIMNYPQGYEFTVFYNIENPNKNGRLVVNWYLALFGVLVIAFSIAGLRQYFCEFSNNSK